MIVKKIIHGVVEQYYDTVKKRYVKQLFLEHGEPQYVGHSSLTVIDDKLRRNCSLEVELKQPDEPTAKELLEAIIEEFPGLSDGETPVRGSDLVDYVTELVALHGV